jgi:hypothetical protein
MSWTRTHTLIAGVALIALTNAIALGGVAWNRAGGPESELKLTQRELWAPYRSPLDRDSGGMELMLRWRVLTAEPVTGYYGDHFGAPEWLDEAKMAALGFDLSRPSEPGRASRRYQRLLPREVLVVLELDGAATKQALERARARAAQEQAKVAAGTGKSGPGSPAQMAADFLKREEAANSRLFAVDAGLDAGALRARYPDRSRYAIVRGKVRPQLAASRGKETKVAGYIESLDIARINVPIEFRRTIQAIAVGPRALPLPGPLPAVEPPFEVTVAFGKRFEPWIVAASTASR